MPTLPSVTYIPSECPATISGLNTADHDRIIVFKETGGHHYIDFVSHPIISNCLYIIPSHHFHYLSSEYSGRFVCMTMTDNPGQSYTRELVNNMKYKYRKSWYCMENRYEQWLDDENNMLPMLKAYSRSNRTLSRLAGRINMTDQLTCAETFVQALSHHPITYDSLGEQLWDGVPVHERTLRRACKIIYDRTPKDMLRYHLTTKAVFLLAHAKFSISEVSRKLKFSDNANFTRFMKSITGYTPSDVRRKLVKKGVFV